MSTEKDLCRVLFETASEAILIVQHGQIVECNASAAQLFGYSQEALLGQTLLDVSPSTQSGDRPSQQLLQEKMDAALSGQSARFEWQYRHSNGEIFYAQLALNAVTHHNETYFQIMVHDISQYKQTEQALEQQRSFLRQIIDANPHFIFAKDWDGRITLVNEAMASYYGTTPEELVNTTSSEFGANSEELEAFLEDDREVMRTRKPKFIPEEMNTAPNGEVHWFQTIKLPLIDSDGSCRQILGVATDITQRRQLEQQIQKSLERRGRQVQLSTLIAQEIAAAANLDELYQRVVTEVKEQFGYYHAQLFRFDPESETLVLTAGYGEVGQQMVAQGYRVPMGVGIVGRAATFGTPILYSNVKNRPDWEPYPHLPETKGEIAVPIRLGQQDASAQIIALNGFIEAGFDGFIVCTIEPEAVTPVVREALNKGLQVLTQSHDLGRGNQTAYVGAEEYETGYMLGLEAGRWAKTHLSADEPLKVGVLNHRGLPAVVRREQGIVDGIEAGFEREFEIVASETGPNPVLSVPITKRWLQEHPGLNMIVGINDGGALGAYQVIKAAGKNDPDRFFIGGVDAIDEALDAIAAGGAFQATVDKSAREEAIIAVRALVTAIAGRPYREKNLIRTRPVNRANLDELLAQRQTQPSVDAPELDKLDLKGVKIGLSVMNLNNPFFAAFAENAAEEAGRLGIELVINDPKPVLGVLNVQTDTANVLDPEEQLSLEGLSGQVAFAMENIRLLEESKIFRQFVEASGQGMGFATLDGEAIYLNSTFGQILDAPDFENILGESVFQYFPKEVLDRLQNEILPVVMQKGRWSGELPLRSTKGKIVPAIQSFTLIHDDNGNPQYLADVVTDITDRKQTEAELEARLQELSALQRLMTKEGWQAFRTTDEEAVAGYLFDQLAVHPVTAQNIENGEGQTSSAARSETDNGHHSFTRPVAVHGEVIGQLGVYDDPDAPLDSDDQEFLDLVAEQVAEALERARLLEQTQQRAVELEAVAQVSTAASTTLEIEKLLDQVVNLTKSSFGLYHTHIYLLNDGGDALNLVAGAGEIGQQMVDQGWSISLQEDHSLVAHAARTQQGVIVNDVQAEPDFLPNALLPNTRSELAVPLIAGTRMLGVLDVQSDKVDRFNEEDLQIHMTLASQVAIAIRNTNLYAQVQEALTETEVLYEISAQINAAVTLDEALQAATTPAAATNAHSSMLLTFELDAAHQPEFATVAALWGDDERPAMEIGTRFHLSEFPFARLWMKDPHSPVLIDDVKNDKRLDAATRRLFHTQNVSAFVLMPLALAGRWVGIITINWTETHSFTDTDQRLYKSLATQAAMVVNNLSLLTEAQRRAAQLEELSQLEVNLSQAENEDEIVATVAREVDKDKSTQVSLYYIETNAEGQPNSLHLVSSWQNGAIWADNPALGVAVSPDQLLGSQFWLDAPETPLFIDDLAEDTRLDENERQLARQANIKQAVILPLYIGGRWQGVMFLSWHQPRGFTADETFVFQQLREPVSAVVASRRAYLGQRQALAEAEALYTASQRINEAGDLQEIVAAVIETGPVSVIDRAVLEMFEHDSAGQVTALTVVANWHRQGQTTPPVPVGKQFTLAKFPHLKRLLTAKPLFHDDVQHDERIDPETLEVLEQSNVRAMTILPLWVGSRQLGVLRLESEKPYQFTEHEMQPYTTLARQVAVALENQRLLLETSKALAEVEATQRRYTLQTWETYLAKSKAISYQLTREQKEGLVSDLPFESSQDNTQQQIRPTTYPADTPAASATDASDGGIDNGQQEQIAPKSNLLVPLKVRGETIGVLGLEEIEEREWAPEEQALVETIAQHLAQAAENLRLIDETQQRAAREKRLNEIGDKIQAAQSLEEALQIAVKEVGLSLQAPETLIKLGLD